MKIQSITIYILGALLLAACDSGTATPEEPDRTLTGPILFGARAETQAVRWASGRTGSRAGGEIEAVTPEDLGIFAFGDGPNTTYIFRNQRVLFYDGSDYQRDPFDWEWWDPDTVSQWPYTIDPGGSVQRPWEKMRYRFFAYSPWYKTGDVSVTAENYSGFNSFQWKNVPGFSDKDFVVANEIVQHDNTGGTFHSENPVVKFEMRHILSRVRFFFRLHRDYRKLRRFEINTLTVLTAGDVKTATFNFRDGAWDETVHWSNEEPGDADPVTLTSVDGLAYDIPTEYADDPFASVYVYPQTKFKEVKMTIDYTVYDSDGMQVRRSQVTNIVTIPGDGWNLQSGYYYDIFITIFPDYLYVLSDHDQDFDGYVIIKDDVNP